MLTVSLYSVSKALLTLIYSGERMLSNIFFLVDWDGTKKPRSTQTKESSNWPGGAVRCTKKMCLPLYFHGCLFRLRNFVPFYFKLLLVCSREICSSHLLFFCLRKNEAILCLTSATKLKRKWHYVTMILERCDYHFTPAVHHSTSEYVHLYDETEPLKLQRKMKVGMPSSRNKHPRWTREEWLNKTRFSNIIFF